MGPDTCASFGAKGLPSMEPVAAGVGCTAAAGAASAAGASPDGWDDDAGAAEPADPLDSDDAEDDDEEELEPADADEPEPSSELVSSALSTCFGAPPQATASRRGRLERMAAVRMGAPHYRNYGPP
jgi:hypothetical protein